MSQLFYIGQKKYNIPDNLVSRFIEDYPDAEKAYRYKVGDKKYAIPESINDTFKSQYPDAKPYFPQLENPLGYTTESIQNIMQSERGMPKDYGDDVTLKVKDVSTLAENLKRVVNAEALPDSTKTVAKQSRIRDENENKMGFWEGASQDILEKIPFSPAGILKLIDLQNATIRLDLLERGDDYGYRMYEKVPAYSMTTMGGIAPVMGAGATPESDIKLINDYFNKVAERERRGSSTGGKIGAGLSVLPAWMIEFMVTGGLKNIVEKGTYNFLENRLKSQIINKTLSSVAGSAARTTLGMPHRVIESSLRRSIENPDEGWATALAKGWGETFIEVASEETGGTITKILGKGLTKLPFGSKFINAIRKVHPRGSQPGFASELLTKGGYSNIIGELGEERVATILHAIANTNDFGLGKDSNIIDRLSAGISQDWSNIPVELVVLGVPGAAKLVSQYAEVKSLKDKVDNPATKEKLQTELNNIREQVDNVLEKSSGVIVNEGDIPILKTVPTELQSLYQKQTDLYRQLKSEENPNKIHSLESQLDPLTDQINSYVYGKPKVEAGKVETKSVPEEGGLILPTDISNKIKSDKVQELEKQYSKTESILKRVKKPETRARLEGELDNISKQLEIALETAKPTEESTVAGIKPQEAEQTIPEQGAKPIAEPQVMPVAQQTPETKAEMPTKPEKPAEAVKSALEKAQVSESFANRYKIVETPLSEINIDVKSYQNRGEAYSQETYDSILNDIRKGEFDWKRFKPIVLWDNPKTGTRDLLEGHSRKAAFEQAVKEGYTEFETIPSYIAKGGTFEEAQRFAKEQSNVGQTREMDYERAKIYRSDREGGMSKKDILAKAVNLEGRRAAPYIVRLSHLDPRGDSIRLIESLKNSADKNEVGRAEKIADWIGRARDKYPELTNLHETEIFKWLFGDQDNVGMAIRFNTVNQFLDRVDAVVNRIGFEQDKPLNIKNLSVKSEGELQYAEEISNIDKELKQANKHRADIATRLSEQGLNPDEISKNEIHRQATADVVALERNLERLRLGESNVKAESRKQTNLFDSAIKLTKTELKNEGLTDEQVRRTESVFSGRKESEIADFESKIESIQAQEKPRPENPKPSRTTGEEVRAGINTAKPAEKLSVSTIPDAKYIGMQERPDGTKFPLFNITKEGHPRQGSTVSAETLKKLNLNVPEVPKPEVTQKPSESIYNTAKTKFDQMIAKSSPEMIEKANENYITVADKFADKYVNKEQNPELHKQIHDIYYDYFRKLDKPLNIDVKRATEDFNDLRAIVAGYDSELSNKELSAGKRSEYQNARQEAIKKMKSLNEKYKLDAGEFNLQLFPGSKALSKWLQSKLPKSDAGIVDNLIAQQNELNQRLKKLTKGSREYNLLDQELQSISDNINKISKGVIPPSPEDNIKIDNAIKDEKDARNRLLAKAHVIEKQKHISPEKSKRIKNKLFGSKSLADATNEQISTYMEIINNNGKHKKLINPTIRKTLQNKTMDMPDRIIQERDAYKFSNKVLEAESGKNVITTKLTETKWVESLHKFKQVFRWSEAIQRKTGKKVYDGVESLRTCDGMFEKHYNDILNKLPNEYHNLTKEERESITDWLKDSTIKITPKAKKIAVAFKEVWYDTDMAKLILRVNRFQEWLINPSQMYIKGVPESELQRLKTIWMRDGDLALIEAIKNVKGFTIEKDYSPDITAIDELPLFVPIGVDKGLLQTKSGDGGKYTERDAVKVFNKKLRSDLKILYLNDAIRSMNRFTGDADLPEGVRKDISNYLRNYVHADEPFFGEKVTSLVVQAALTTPKNWFRDSFQRLNVISYTRPADIPKRTSQLIGSFVKRGAINIDKSKSWKSAPEFVKNYFEVRVSESSAINHEFMGMASHPILSRMGKIGETTKQILRTSSKIDMANRWSNFAPIYKDVRIALESGKSFDKIKQRIYWNHLSGELKKNLLPEIDSKNYDYVSLRIAEEIASGKTQWRYGLHEKSIQEQKPIWHFLLRVTTYSRSNIEAVIDDAKTLGNGIVSGDVKQFYSGFQAIVGRLMLQYAIGEFIVQPVLGKRKDYGYGTDIMEVFDPELGGIANSVVGFYSGLEKPLTDIGDNLIKNYVTGEINDEEFTKIQNKAINNLIKNVDTITYSTIVGYRQILWMLEGIYGIDKIRPFRDTYEQVVKDKGWNNRRIERDAWEILRHTVFGTDSDETLEEKRW